MLVGILSGRKFLPTRIGSPLSPFDSSRSSLMKAIVNRIAAAFSIGFAFASPLPAQNAAASCDPTANTRGDIAKAQFSMTRAISGAEKGTSTKDVQDVLRLVDNGTDNPTARSYLRGEAYVVYLMQPNVSSV